MYHQDQVENGCTMHWYQTGWVLQFWMGMNWRGRVKWEKLKGNKLIGDGLNNSSTANSLLAALGVCMLTWRLEVWLLTAQAPTWLSSESSHTLTPLTWLSWNHRLVWLRAQTEILLIELLWILCEDFPDHSIKGANFSLTKIQDLRMIYNVLWMWTYLICSMLVEIYLF